MVEFRTVDQRVLLRILERQLGRMLAGELRPPAEHDVVRRVFRIPAQQAVGHGRAGARLLEKRRCPCPMAGYGGRSGACLDEIVGRVDRGHGSIVKGHEEPQVHAIELRVPFELDEILGWRGFRRRHAGWEQADSTSTKTGRSHTFICMSRRRLGTHRADK